MSLERYHAEHSALTLRLEQIQQQQQRLQAELAELLARLHQVRGAIEALTPRPGATP